MNVMSRTNEEGLNRSSKSASTTSHGTAFQAEIVIERNAY